uniref:NR LBD domain-containing protein n=1 Tax=Panagrolaimus sp. PS1159 TaxID=55785 RepID=A0AC35GCF1_9BILA
MSEDNFREPYSITKSETSSEAQSSVVSPAVSLPNPKNLSPASESIITFLKSMTRSTIENYDPSYDALTLEECLKFPVNRNANLSDGLRNPHVIVPKMKFDLEWFKYSNMSFGWYQIFVYVAEWAKGIPQFRMLKAEDQERLFHLNFATLSFPMCFYYMVGDCEKMKEFMYANNNFIEPGAFGSEIIMVMGTKLLNIYETHLFSPYRKLKPDDEEMALGMTLMLFQFSESLSNEGHLICSKYKEKLYTALYEYQMIKFADKTELERIQRYTMLMELMHRVTKIWSEECEFHLLLSTFNEMNVDGLLKELLFTKCLTKHGKG